MKRILILALLACPAASNAGPFGNLFHKKDDLSGVLGPSSNPKNVGENSQNPRPPESYVEQWYTTPDGCSYSRAKAPGYPQSWHLIMNPHHIGQPNAHSGCPVML